MEKQNSILNNGNKVKLLCSYGGRIHPRPTDHQLSYIGGDTKILAVDRNVKFAEIIAKFNSLINKNDNSEVSLKYQLPGEDLDVLVSLIDDDDVEHMMVEYDRMQRSSAKPARLRLFVFDLSSPAKSDNKDPGLGTNLNLNSNPDYLFGFDKEYQPSNGPPLDLLQIPGMVLPQNYELVPRDGFDGKSEGHVTGRVENMSVNGGGPQVVYRIPVVGNGGVYQTGQYAYGVVAGMVDGNLEQPMYNFVPIMSSAPGRE